ncbi:hypothetical protein DSM14862_00860 [Sulfitobacter indolifex]|nr:hypothetical protein DSM14862_00860 [Sulfitobacter indolifex]
MRTRFFFSFLAFWICSTSVGLADSHNFSRHWHTHLWVWEHSDVEVNVYHLPNGTIRGIGRFSNGLQTIDRKYALGIFVETAAGEVWHMIINERVPPSGAGGTQVKWKSDEMLISGEVLNVYAEAKILNKQSGTFGLTVKCKYGEQETKCKWPKPFYEKEKGNLLAKYAAATEKGKVDICAGFEPRAWNTVYTGNWTECDSATGVISEQSKSLERPIPKCPACAIE